MTPPVESPASIVDEFKAFLDTFAGTQRELLVALDATWIPRILERAGGERAIAAAVIRKKIKSKKLVDERERLVERLFDEGVA